MWIIEDSSDPKLRSKDNQVRPNPECIWKSQKANIGIVGFLEIT